MLYLTYPADEKFPETPGFPLFISSHCSPSVYCCYHGVLKSVEAYFELQIITLIFLLPVILSTVLWGLTPGSWLLSWRFLAFNYYFIQPYYTFQVHKTQDLITLIIFLIVLW